MWAKISCAFVLACGCVLGLVYLDALVIPIWYVPENSLNEKQENRQKIESREREK